MLIFTVALSTIAVLVFVEWQYSIMGRRLRARSKAGTQASSPRRRQRR